MIMARNEDGTYSQVGFVKDNVGIDTEYIYDKDGDIVFEKGFTRETSGTVPLTINGIGKDLKDWSITGNTVQDGTPTPENPVEVQAVGDRTGNLFDKDKQAGIIYVTETVTRYGVEIPVSAGTYSIVGGTNKLFVKKKHGTTYGTAIDTSAQRTITLPQNGYILIYAERIEDYTVSNIMLNLGSTSLPYEPYGYKIPVVTSADGTEPITTPIYLPTPLYSGEVMRSDGTITRSDGTTETFTAPQIPTLNGTTVIDVDTAVKPTEMYTKYKSSK